MPRKADDEDNDGGAAAAKQKKMKAKEKPRWEKNNFGNINSCRSSTMEITLAAVFVSLLKFLVEQIDSKFWRLPVQR